MKIPTLWVTPDEKAEGYFIGPVGNRMLERIWVYRDDMVACYEEDKGSVDDYEYVPPLAMPSYGEETVASLRWHGERHLHDPKWAKRIKELKESSTLFEDVIAQEERRSYVINNRSVIGPVQTTQRNGYPGQHLIREYKEERARRTGRRNFPT